MNVSELTPNQLYHSCDPHDLSFETTDDLEVLNHFIGQPRAIEALEFGVGIRQEGYNIKDIIENVESFVKAWQVWPS
jgi:hypothetical protein